MAGSRLVKRGTSNIGGGVVPATAKVRKSADQTALVTGTATKLTFDTTIFDDAGYFDNANDRFVVPTGYGGVHRVSGVIAYVPAATSAGLYTRIHVNGSLRAVVLVPSVNSATIGSVVGISTLLNLVAGDYVELYALHQTGSNRDVDGGTEQETHFCIERMAVPLA